MRRYYCIACEEWHDSPNDCKCLRSLASKDAKKINQ